MERIGTNSGHGHAWERPDGIKARCGGTMLCQQCKLDTEMVLGNKHKLRPADKANADFLVYARAISIAKKNGYDIYREREVIQRPRSAGKTTEAIERMRSELLTVPFAQAFFGIGEVDEYGQSLNIIKLYAEQVAYEFDGKVYAADKNKPYMTFARMPELTFTNVQDELLVMGEQVTLKLEHMAGSIPFKTHKITEIDIYGEGGRAWDWHLKNMVVAPDVFDYINTYMKEQEKQDGNTTTRRQK